MSNKPRYVIITPVKDEANYVKHTLTSVLSQSVQPLQWIIVDDGSTDGTAEILDECARNVDWIEVIHRTHRGPRRVGGRVIEAFNAGYDVLSNTCWDFIVKLDSDLSFQPNYFAMLLERFVQDSRLGIASGVYLEIKKDGRWREIAMPAYHAAGACKVIRRKCFDEIGGFIVGAGWDTVDEIRAMTRGWRTGHFRELQMKHHKAEGSGVGVIRTSVMHGEIYYLTGGSNLFFLVKILHRFGAQPYVINALALTWGYIRAVISNKQRLVKPDEAIRYQAVLHERLRIDAKKLFVRN